MSEIIMVPEVQLKEAVQRYTQAEDHLEHASQQIKNLEDTVSNLLKSNIQLKSNLDVLITRIEKANGTFKEKKTELSDVAPVEPESSNAEENFQEKKDDAITDPHE